MEVVLLNWQNCIRSVKYIYLCVRALYTVYISKKFRLFTFGHTVQQKKYIFYGKVQKRDMWKIWLWGCLLKSLNAFLMGIKSHSVNFSDGIEANQNTGWMHFPFWFLVDCVTHGFHSQAIAIGYSMSSYPCHAHRHSPLINSHCRHRLCTALLKSIKSMVHATIH